MLSKKIKKLDRKIKRADFFDKVFVLMSDGIAQIKALTFLGVVFWGIFAPEKTIVDTILFIVGAIVAWVPYHLETETRYGEKICDKISMKFSKKKKELMKQKEMLKNEDKTKTVEKVKISLGQEFLRFDETILKNNPCLTVVETEEREM